MEDEALEQEPELYQCETCPVADAQGQLWTENAEAWGVFQRLAQRFVIDTHLGPSVFAALTADAEPDAVVDLVERLGVMYDIVAPPQPKQS